MAERIDLSRADDPRDVVHRAVACLAQGGVIGLPTEASYGIAAAATHAGAIGRLRELDAKPRPPTLLLRGPGEVEDWGRLASVAGQRLARRAWPGPVTLVLPVLERGLGGRLPAEVGPFLAPEGLIALRSPSDWMVREILRLMPGPILLADPPGRPDSGPATVAECLEGLEGLDMILDVGPTSFAGPATRVAIPEGGWSIVEAGVTPEAAIARMAGKIILFVCTGNTCRSPMAEAICKVLLAKRLKCAAAELVDRGYVVLSAGVATSNGLPAAEHAVEVVRLRGGSLDDHSSRKATYDLVRHADHVLAMTIDHLEILLDQVPEAVPVARLLDPEGDIDDPIGSGLETYQRTARQIERHLDKFLDDLGI